VVHGLGITVCDKKGTLVMSHNSGYARQVVSSLLVATLCALGLVGFTWFSKKQSSKPDESAPTVSGTTADVSSPGSDPVLPRDEEPAPEPSVGAQSELERAYRYERYVTFDPAQEPDWKLRREFYREFLQGKFTPPSEGEALTVPLIGRGSISGTLVSIHSNSILLQVGQAEMDIAVSQLSAEGRALFFEPDALQWNSTQNALRERDQWRSRKSKLEREAQRAASPRSTLAGKPPPPGKPRNRPPDGSVYQVAAYLEKKLPDPASTTFLEWSEVAKAPEGFRVRCRYKTKSKSGDYVVRTQLFVMDGNGKILKVDPYR